MSALLLAALWFPAPISLDAQEILVSDLPQIAGVPVEFAPADRDCALFVRVQNATPKEFLGWVAKSLGVSLSETATGFRLAAVSMQPRSYGWDPFARDARTALGTRTLAEIREESAKLEARHQTLITENPAGWQAEVTRLGKRRAPLEAILQTPLVYPLLRAGIDPKPGETQILPISGEMKRELETEFPPQAPGERTQKMVYTYRLTNSGLQIALAVQPARGQPVITRGTLELFEEPPLTAIQGELDDPLPDATPVPRRYGTDGTVWLRQLPGNLVVMTVRERFSDVSPAKSAFELRGVLSAKGFELVRQDGAWTGHSPDALRLHWPMGKVRAIERNQGLATLEAFASLSADLPDADPGSYAFDLDLLPLAQAQPALRAYATLSADRQARMRERIPLTVDELNPEGRRNFWNALRQGAEPGALAKMALLLDPGGDLGEVGLSFHLSHFARPVNVRFSGPRTAFVANPTADSIAAVLRSCEFRLGYSAEESMLYQANLLEPVAK